MKLTLLTRYKTFQAIVLQSGKCNTLIIQIIQTKKEPIAQHIGILCIEQNQQFPAPQMLMTGTGEKIFVAIASGSLPV